jgi:glutamate decarboxylase
MSELILGALNATAHVYHVSPCLIQMELAAGRELTNLLGYSGPSRGGLTFPGGSQSNFMAISLARNLKFPSIKINGFDGEKLAIFTPQQGHYSIDKAAISLGVGLKRVYKVPCNINGSMIPEQLELMIQKSIQNGEQPFFVNSSAGSTVLGAFDDFGKISQICKKYDLWYHIDGSWGGSIIFSKTHRQLLNNAELSDSFTVNPHKLLGVPVQCSYLLLQDRFLLNQAHTLNADYLFHNNNATTNSANSSDNLDPDSWLYSNMDLADGTVGCGRRPDGFKMFLTWKYVGTEGFTKRVDHALSCAQFFQHKIQQHPNFKLLVPATSLNVCFYYLPSCRDQGLFNETVLTTNSEIPQIPEHYSYITRDIIEMMKEEGKIMIDYSPLQVYNELTNSYETIPHFFRMIFNHPKTSELSIINLINEINRFGKELME